MTETEGEFIFLKLFFFEKQKLLLSLAAVVKRTAWHPCCGPRRGPIREVARDEIRNESCSAGPRSPAQTRTCYRVSTARERTGLLWCIFLLFQEACLFCIYGPRNSKYYLTGQFSRLKSEESILFV